MIRLITAVLCCIIYGTAAARSAECPGNPNALGTSRILAVDPIEHARLGTMQYGQTLPLADREIVLTFDDGPLPPNSSHVLDILASECVKATFFIVGEMARAHPDLLRRIYANGHTIGTHSQGHPKVFNKLSVVRAQNEIEDGIASTAAALGNHKAVAPFFRIPGLARATAVENYLVERRLMLWSADFLADDWRHISASEVLSRALGRIEAKGKGILLLHDIKSVTVDMLPALLHELKVRGYRIVHVVPAGIDQPKTVTASQDWISMRTRKSEPQLVSASVKARISKPRAMAAPTEPTLHDIMSARGEAKQLVLSSKCRHALKWLELDTAPVAVFSC
jgi:peptidoglycan-N-acetylglucosamine deacetylase